MKNFLLILITLITLACLSYLNAQISTNKIQNTATIMLTNSTLYVGGTNNVINGTRYNSGQVLTLYGRDGAIVLIPTAIHNRVNINWTTNLNNPVPTWSLGQDFDGSAGHTFGIQNNIDGSTPFLITSNQTVTLIIPLVAVSSNMIITNNLTVLGTNNSRFYMVNGVRGTTLSVTNVGIGMTNVEVFAEGILTNKFTIP